jgi:5-carboxymethyl-2-hydroxymuconate isomerase
MKIEALPVGGLRIRAVGCEPVKVGDGDPKNQFIYLTVRLGQGRSEAVKREIGDRLFKIVTTHTQGNFAKGTPLSLGLEIQEIEKDWTWKKNNIHQIIKDKS